MRHHEKSHCCCQISIFLYCDWTKAYHVPVRKRRVHSTSLATRQPVHNRTFIDRSTTEQVNTAHARPPRSSKVHSWFFIKHLRRSNYLVLFSKLTPIAGELFILGQYNYMTNTYSLEPRETVSFVAPRAFPRYQ